MKKVREGYPSVISQSFSAEKKKKKKKEEAEAMAPLSDSELSVLRKHVYSEEERQNEAMGTSVQLTPLSGVYSESHLCYLLDVDGFRFLLDCGWDDRLNVDALQPLARSVHIFNSLN